MEQRNHGGQVVVLPYPSQGQINPLRQFAKRLASKDVKDTLATTHYTVKSICVPNIAVEPISDGFDNGGFTQADTEDVYLKSLRENGSRTLSQLIEKHKNTNFPINCVVYDSIFPWALDVAKTHGIYGAPFFTNSATVCAIFCLVHHGLVKLPVKVEELPLVLPGIPPLNLVDLPSFVQAPESYPAYLAMKLSQYSNLDKADWVFGNTFEELEGELHVVFNKFHNKKINAKRLDATCKSLEEKYYYLGKDCCRFIRRGDVAGTSLSGPSSLKGAGNPSTSGYLPGKNARGGGLPVNGNSNSSVKHSPPGEGKVPREEGAGSSMNAPREVVLEMGCVNDNGNPPAPGDVPSSVVLYVAHTADRSGEYGVNVARTVFRVSAAAASGTTTSYVAKASYAIGLADSGAAILLADTHWRAATPILAKAGIVACGVGVLAEIGKDLPLPLFMGAMTAAIFIIVGAMVFAKHLA